MTEHQLREHEIQLALLPKDEADARSAILEVRPAAGGDEAGLFAAELFAMYQKYSETHGWRFEILDYSDTGLGGLKDATADLSRPTRLRARCGDRFMQWSGDDATAPAYRAMGGHCCISVTANVAPALCARLHAAWNERDLARFAALRDCLDPLHAALFVESNPIPVKAALASLNLCSDEVRLPLTLAIIEGLLIRVGKGRYIIPLSAVDECVELTHADERSSGTNFLNVRGDLVPFLRLRKIFESDGEPDRHQKIIITSTGDSQTTA